MYNEVNHIASFIRFSCLANVLSDSHPPMHICRIGTEHEKFGFQVEIDPAPYQLPEDS